MVLTEEITMSRTDEVHRITENVYKTIMEQFNPCLRNFIAMGKNYEKALSNGHTALSTLTQLETPPELRWAKHKRSADEAIHRGDDAPCLTDDLIFSH